MEVGAGIDKRLEISPRAVEKQISKLRKEGLLRRIGPAKGGRWDVRWDKVFQISRMSYATLKLRPKKN
jgi:predicted HTH transcriptional regulator